MNTIQKTILLFCMILLSFPIYSQRKWTLRNCIDYAIDNNIEIKQQALRVEISEVNLNTSKNSRLPDLNAEVSQAFSYGQPASGTGVSQRLDLTNVSFSIQSSIPVFTGFKINNEIKRDRFDLKASMENLKKAKENMELHITSLYLKCLLDKEMVKIYKEIANLTQKQVTRTEILVQSGTVPESQLYDIKSQQANDELNLVSMENESTLSLLYLAQALNFPNAENFDIAEPSTDDDIMEENMKSLTLSPDRIYEVALGIKPHVKEAKYLVDKSEAEIEIAKSYYWPTLNFGISLSSFYNYIHDNQTISDGVTTIPIENNSFSTQFKDHRSEIIGLNLIVPIFNRNKTRNQVRTAKINRTDKLLVLDNIKLALYKEIQEAYTSALSSKSKYTASQKALRAAQESYDYAEWRYEVGNITVFEYNEIQTKLFTSKSEQVRAKYDFLFRTKILDFYQGVKISFK